MLSSYSTLTNIYGGVFIFSGKNYHNILVNYCQFISNFAEYEGKYINNIYVSLYSFLGAVYYSLSSSVVTDTGSLLQSNIFR